MIIKKNKMKIALLSNIFEEDIQDEYKEARNEVKEIIRKTQTALEFFGHEVTFYDVNERAFEKLRRAKPDAAFNICEEFNSSGLFEPHVAAMLELLGIPYTGSGPLALATCLNKVMVKAILMHHEIPTAKYQVFTSRYKKLDEELRFPLIVKPASTDASIGIEDGAVAANEEELRSRINYVLKSFNQPALVEEFVGGKEFTVSIMGNGKDAAALPICEIAFKKTEGASQYSICGYASKWKEDVTTYNSFCPAPIPKYLENKLKKIALDTHRVLGVRDYSRVDIRLDEKNNPYVLEMNPNPGISADSFLPYSAELLNIDYNEMINIILNCALERQGIANDKKVSRLADFIREDMPEEKYAEAEKKKYDFLAGVVPLAPQSA